MIYKDFGTTGKKVSAIGFGGMRFLPDEYKQDVQISARLVLEAAEKGVNFFDTAPGYCSDKSEIIMGEAFKQLKYGDFYVSTKCGLWNAKDADGARRMIDKSLERLNVPKITFYFMWCVKNLGEYRQMTAKGGIFDGIYKAYEEGLIEHICCSTHANGDEITEIIDDGRVEGIMLGYNAINFAYRRKGIQACGAANKGVVVMNPLGGGIIPEFEKHFEFLKNDGDDNIAVSAMKFLVAHDEITVTLPGIGTSQHLDEAIAATKNLPVVDDAYVESLAKQLNQKLDTLCTGCAYCDECPLGVEVPKLLDSFNHAILSGGVMKPVMDKLRNHWGVSAESANKCNGCGKCVKLCTQKLPIIERLKEIGSYTPPTTL